MGSHRLKPRNEFISTLTNLLTQILKFEKFHESNLKGWLEANWLFPVAPVKLGLPGN